MLLFIYLLIYLFLLWKNDIFSIGIREALECSSCIQLKLGCLLIVLVDENHREATVYIDLFPQFAMGCFILFNQSTLCCQ